MSFLERIISFLQDWFKKKTDREKRRIILSFTAVFAVLLTFSVIVSLGGSKKVEGLDMPERAKINIAIPPEELFIPDEPDYLPGVLFERDIRTGWTELDALEYWQDPLRYGEEQWREKIEASIDEFLERVP